MTPALRLQKAKQSYIWGRMAVAERELRTVLAEQPDDLEANRTLTLILNTEGRRFEANPFAFNVLRLGGFSIQDLVLLATPQEPYEDEPAIKDALAQVPDDPLPSLGRIHPYRRENRDNEAVGLLRTILAKYPRQMEAQAQLGILLLDLERESEFLSWQAQLPDEAKQHPETWIALGRWAQRHKQMPQAARCFWEAVKLAPNFRLANFYLGMILENLGQSDAAAPLLERTEQLADLEQTVFPIFSHGPDLKAMRRAAVLTESLGRLWEAWGWHVAVLSVEPEDETARLARDRLRGVLESQAPPQTVATANPVGQLDLSHYGLPQFPSSASVSPPERLATVAKAQFADQAVELGIEFTYYDSWTPAGRELMLLETIGGGVAILDYDLDGWPDIYFTQCCPWPLQPDQTDQIDRLFRNLGDGSFRDVTLEAGIFENGYSQGVAAGDVNNDGFPDIYVANVGQNRLYQNNGDGTFRLVSHHTDSRLIWTCSVLIADLNRDSLPDIFDVNYVTGEDVYTKHCVIEGLFRSCGPSLFDGEVDFLYLNQGDGQWRDVSEEAGIHSIAGRGLGIVAADFARSGRLALYISNDVMGNFLLVDQSPSPGSTPQYVDQGVLTGVAFDKSGRTQASMGIAADDVNGDGQLDLLVANYYHDSNTLYLQESGFFTDETHLFRLREPSFFLLTFGSQFLDGDLDGYPDLVITNGHVDDMRFRDEPWHMRPQYFHNDRGTQFVEVPPLDAGTFFQKEYLGRGVAVVDWNRDGREDFVVSNIAAAASVATNQTPDTGHFLIIRLVGTQDARDAIGTQVTVQCGDTTRVRQLVGGSGFEAGNQPQLVFGLGQHRHVDTITVSWPNGGTQEFRDLPADRELVLIQGHAVPHPLPLAR